ncbi:hypothetical protein ACLM45_05505 [Synechococcus sp. A10-1-5-9]|uniref:hypothetical protein n=1 Tax=Synechococcus sp. A10-1-5-9 TaxID=3392295 RepID=UPI0039E7D350
MAALGAVLMLAAYSLLNLASLKRLWTLDCNEFVLSLITSLGVVTLGAINGILIAVALAIIRFMKHTARPMWMDRDFLDCCCSASTHHWCSSMPTTSWPPRGSAW